MDRRDVLKAGVQACGLAALGSGGFLVTKYLSPIPTGLGEDEVEIPENEIEPGEAVQVMHKGKPVLIVRDQEGQLHGLSAVCTHLGCLVKWDGAQGRILCPCHDAFFTLEGDVISGPAPKALPLIPIGVRNGLITLDPNTS